MELGMKTSRTKAQGLAARLAMNSVAVLAGLVTAQSSQQLESREANFAADKAFKEDENLRRSAAGAGREFIKIESIEPSRGKDPAKQVAWLGVSTEEVTDALASQLGLKSGEGLVVTFVAPDSPAAKAGIEKHDVLVELGEQLLVHPAQLRKLVRTGKEGDTVNIRLYRCSQKQTVSVTLGKTTERVGLWLEGPLFDEKQQVAREEAISERIREQMKNLGSDLAQVDANKRKIEQEVQRSIEQARKSLQDALRHNAHGVSVLGQEQAKQLEALAREGVGIGKGATVVVKKDSNSVKSMVKTDDTGTYVIVANPRKRLTAHDQEGKLLFDGEIETEEQQEQVPPGLWQKVKPMLEQLGPVERDEPKPQAQSTGEKKT